MAKAVAVPDDNNGMDRVKSPFQKMSVFWAATMSEMKRVTVPNRDEVQSTTIVVIVTTFLFAAFFAAVDFVSSHTVGALLDHLTK